MENILHVVMLVSVLLLAPSPWLSQIYTVSHFRIPSNFEFGKGVMEVVVFQLKPDL